MPGFKRKNRSSSVVVYDATSSPVVSAKKMSYSRGYRRYKQISSKFSTHNFKVKRTICQNLSINPANGFAGTAFDINIVPALAACDINIGGSTIYQPLLPNASEFTNLFDLYRITRVNCTMVYSANDAITSTPSQMLPVLHIANDYNSVGSFTLTDILQYDTVKHWQLGKEREVKWSFVPHTRMDAKTNSGLGTSLASMNKPYQWFDTEASSIQHYGTRVYLNNFGRTTSADIGTVMLLIEYCLEFTFVK